MKLENAQDNNLNKNNFLYLLYNDMELKIGEENSFVVKKTFRSNFPLCSCSRKAQGEFAVFPCTHFVCGDCGKNLKKNCPQCKKPVENKVLLVDIYQPVKP